MRLGGRPHLAYHLHGHCRFRRSRRAANFFAPQVIEIYVGDTVKWTIGGELEPHTISFDPQRLLDTLANANLGPVPPQAGPPPLTFNSQAALPTMSMAYDGTSYANSGLLREKGRAGV